MRTIGIDLGVAGEHKALIADEQGQALSGVISITSEASRLEHLLEVACQGSPAEELQAVMEPTGMAWYPMAVYLSRQGVKNFLVNGQQVADLRKYYKKHAKSDRIDVRVLVKLPVVNPEQLHALELPGAKVLACQRGCKQLDRLVKEHTAIKNRLIAMDRFAWPGLEKQVYSDLFCPAALWFRRHYYSPYQVCRAGVEKIHHEWQKSQLKAEDDGSWIAALVKLAQAVMTLYGPEGEALDYAFLQAEASSEEDFLEMVEQMQHEVKYKVVFPLYRQLHPSRNLESLEGVGEVGAAVYVSFISNPRRFSSLRKLRGWSGMVPNSRQSANSQSNGLKITQAGPRLIKKFAFLDAEVARLRDPQIAAIYYDQMMNKGKHHNQAICTCAAHLLDRILLVLRKDQPFELRDVDGSVVSKAQALEIIAQRYTVPPEVRRRNNKKHRQEATDRQAEKELKVRERGVIGSSQRLLQAR